MSKRIEAEELSRLLQALDGDEKARCDALRALCPCHSRCYDRAAWLAIFKAYHSSREEAVRHQALHAIETLRERVYNDDAPDLQARELAAWLADEHMIFLPADKLLTEHGRRITSREVPRLLQILAGDDAGAQCDALRALCPCRNRRYDKELWLEIMRAYETSDHPQVRDQAHHAIETLRNRVRTDPRSQELARWLNGHKRAWRVHWSVPVWPPRLAINATGALVSGAFEIGASATGVISSGLMPTGVLPDGRLIPSWERSPRSKANRRR